MSGVQQKIDKMFFSTTNYFAMFKNQCYYFFPNGYLSLKFENFAVLSKYSLLF